MTDLTNIAKHSATLTGISRATTDGLIFYAWMFLFTIPQFGMPVTNIAKNSASLTNIAKS